MGIKAGLQALVLGVAMAIGGQAGAATYGYTVSGITNIGFDGMGLFGVPGSIQGEQFSATFTLDTNQGTSSSSPSGVQYNGALSAFVSVSGNRYDVIGNRFSTAIFYSASSSLILGIGDKYDDGRLKNGMLLNISNADGPSFFGSDQSFTIGSWSNEYASFSFDAVDYGPPQTGTSISASFAVPGPIAGAGAVPAFLGLAGFLLWQRRRPALAA